MSAIKEKMAQDLKDAMKQGDSFKRDTIRLLNSALKQVEVDTRKTLDDSGVIAILKTAYKQREDAAMAYKNANRLDLFEKESAEMEIILGYLPKQLTDTELENAIKHTLTQIGAKTPQDMGRAMGALKHLGEVADGRRIAMKVKQLLNQ
ncbi:glutamyl-tRNA amidotransferase [Helicobacter sp. 12S02634-8]|uniref:GatB/YqeY domain-containing protein n=1 Tax=Helicobacter sp. 12S02634-8 TaxID=1476199 RepID=UPI000BA7B53D|nr:GatB/YqeY domain-containing protein [Helicobacter sp. 12S02634-8]PAF47544.1 glutamyl-tRNA amidotransferase [Helicobacter sp. 12S02634-8]